MKKTQKEERKYIYNILTMKPIDFENIGILHENATQISCAVTGQRKAKESIVNDRNYPETLGFTNDRKIANQFPGVKLCASGEPRYKYEFKVRQSCPGNALRNQDFSLFFRHVKHVKIESVSGSDSLYSDITQMNENLKNLNNHLGKERSKDWINELMAIIKAVPLDEIHHEAANLNNLPSRVSTNLWSELLLGKYYTGFKLTAFIIIFAFAMHQGFTNSGFTTAFVLYLLRNASFQEILPHLLSDESLPKETRDMFISQILDAVEKRGLSNQNELFSSAFNPNNIGFITYCFSLFLTVYFVFKVIINCR